MVLQDAAGSLNPRQTVYESVAEGIRLHRRDRLRRAGPHRGRPGLRGAGRGGPAAPGAAVPALPARALRRAAAAGADRRRAGAAARPADRRRAGLLAWTPRSAARSSRCCSSCARTSGGCRGGDPRPRAGLEHRRPDRGDVPRAAWSSAAPPRRSSAPRGTPTPRRCCRSCRRWRSSSRSSSRARSPTRPGSPPAAASTPGAQRCSTASAERPASPTGLSAQAAPRAARDRRTSRRVLARSSSLYSTHRVSDRSY